MKRTLAMLAAAACCLACVPVGSLPAGNAVTASAANEETIKFRTSWDGTYAIVTGVTDKEITELTIPATYDGLPVQEIDGSSLRECASLTTVVLPDSITRIGNFCMDDCTALTTINLPEGLREIGMYAFNNCRSLENITIPKSVEKIGGSAFSGTPWMDQRCIKEKIVIINNIMVNGINTTGDVTVPDGVTCITQNGFFQSRATSVTIPASVQEIGRSAFKFCHQLETITIMNPDCQIEDENDTICNDYDWGTSAATFTGTIIAPAGSTAQAYAEKYGYSFVVMGDTPTTTARLGDLTGDGQINASDAARILIASAEAGIWGFYPSLTREMFVAADVNKDETVDASDAAKVLMYSAAVGTGFKGTMEDYMK